MSPRLFWHTTPRKFSALCMAHIDLNSVGKDKSGKNFRGATTQQQYVDQLSFM